MGTLRQKAGTGKRRLKNAWRELQPPPPIEQQDTAAVTERAVTPQKFAIESAPATERIHARLDASDVEAIAAAANADDTMIDFPVPPGAPPRQVRMTDAWSKATGIERKRLDLVLGAHYEIDSVLEKTGLLTVRPPEEVHAMTHSALGAGGAFYQADLVADGLASARAPIAEGDNILDFGSSSGRVTRALAAAYPEAKLFGCDPNGPAIEWATANLPGIDFRVSPNDPPTSYEDNFFAAAFGISIWSHYNERLALAWYDEMWRILRPGGHLISTTHGAQSVAFYGKLGLRSAQQLTDIKAALYDTGYWYAAEFGKDGDWGVVNDEWGTSFVSQEWVLDKLTPKWEVAEYATARNEDNQDVYVLRKPAA
ncbi:MAG: class I SAM-dependent methyltransferase [Thermoleophilaceae bacterium]|nr:class I SAM-dependent methyltransferase [Thermoleophilaceae bacterium]